jgi:hypothetical protein
MLTTHPLLVPRLRKSRAIPPLTLWVLLGLLRGSLYLYLYLKETAWFLNDKELAVFSERSTSWKIILEPTTGNDAISEVDARMYVVLRKAEKHVPCGESVGTTKCITL